MQKGKHVHLYSEIRFFDSFKFLSQSLESLAKTVQTSSLQLLRNKFFDMSHEKFRGKGFFSLQLFGQLWKNFPTFSCLRRRLEKQLVWKNRHKWTRLWKGKGDSYTDASQQLWWLSWFLIDSRCISLSRYLWSFPWCSSQRVSLGRSSFLFSSKLELRRNVEYD